MARISFQVYLWHFIIVLVFISYFQQPINVTFYLLVSNCLFVIICLYRVRHFFFFWKFFMPLNQNPHQTVTRFGCAGFLMDMCRFSVPQMRQLYLFTYPPRLK